MIKIPTPRLKKLWIFQFRDPGDIALQFAPPDFPEPMVHDHGNAQDLGNDLCGFPGTTKVRRKDTPDLVRLERFCQAFGLLPTLIGEGKVRPALDPLLEVPLSLAVSGEE